MIIRLERLYLTRTSPELSYLNVSFFICYVLYLVLYILGNM